jgi:hypothetical protein
VTRAPDVAHPWGMAYLLEYLRPNPPPESHEFLATLFAAINDPTQIPALDRFPDGATRPPCREMRHGRRVTLPMQRARMLDSSGRIPARRCTHGTQRRRGKSLQPTLILLSENLNPC